LLLVAVVISWGEVEGCWEGLKRGSRLVSLTLDCVREDLHELLGGDLPSL
jgi:hypothetical protein